MKVLILILGTVVACVILALVLRLLNTKAQLREMEEILSEIRAGNKNRRLLAQPGSPVASIAYQINEVVAEYEEQLDIMRRNDEMNRQLMTSLSHDVRTPLTTLIGYLDAVCRGSVSGKERDDYIRTAERKAHDLKTYTDTIFDWFKLNSDEFAFAMEPVEAAELTREILKDWIPVLEENNIDFDVAIPDVPCMAQLDVDAYQRILNNLIQNVVSHSQATHVDILLDAGDQYMSISVVDNGVGISPDDRERIFDRLYKCDMSRSTKGSGLGLSIAKQLVEKMNGSISVESLSGRETRFTVQFPRLTKITSSPSS